MGAGPVRPCPGSHLEPGRPPPFQFRHETTSALERPLIPMMSRIPKSRAEWAAWAKEAEQKSSGKFQFYVLALAAVLMLAHYAIDELNYHPERSLWTAPAFWSGAWVYAALPFINWLVWKALASRLRTWKPILTMAVLAC